MKNFHSTLVFDRMILSISVIGPLAAASDMLALSAVVAPSDLKLKFSR